MNRRTATRTALAVAAVATLAACVVNLSFDMKKSVQVQTNAGVTSYSQNVLVALSDYKEITDHKDNIKSFDLDSVDATVSGLGPNNHATKVSGTLVLRKVLTDDPANDIPVGSFTNVSVQVGQSVNIKGTPALDAFLLQQLQTAGTFYAVITNGNVDGQADVTLDLTMHVSIGYDAGLL
jgi:hypothetical protein